MEAFIPDKVFFKIGEVAKITSLRPSVLRYWETEFDMLVPRKSRSGQRLYTKDDLELVHEIKKLLYRDKLTIAGARKKFGSRHSQKGSEAYETGFVPDKVIIVINEVKDELIKIKNSL